MPSTVAQSSPAPFAVAFRFEANFGESLRAGGVGAGSCELSQIVAARAGPSTSGAGAGFSFGRRTVRSFVAFHPLAAFADRLADCFGPLVTVGAPALPAVDGRLRLAGGVVSSTAGADEVASAGVAVASTAAGVSVPASAGPPPAATGAAPAAPPARRAVAAG